MGDTQQDTIVQLATGMGELKAQMTSVSADVKALRESTQSIANDHEQRIRTIENLVQRVQPDVRVNELTELRGWLTLEKRNAVDAGLKWSQRFKNNWTFVLMVSGGVSGIVALVATLKGIIH